MKILLVFFLLLFSLRSVAQHYNFTNYTVKDGLAQSQVRDICQDEEGYLWIGTASGLSRYNGIEFVNYSIDDGLPDNNISKLFLSKNGHIWIATAGGIAQFGEQQFTSYSYNNEEYRVNDIAEFKDDIYFASNTGLLHIENDSFVQLGDEAAHEYYLRSIVNYKDSILIGGSKSGLYTWNGAEFNEIKLAAFPELNVRNLVIKGDMLYVTARNIGMFTYNLKTKKIFAYHLLYTTLLDIDVNDKSIFGITTNAGAFLIRQNDTLYFDDQNGLMRSGLECLFRDREGNIWLGTDGNGLLKFSGTSVVSYSTKDGLASDLVLAIEQDQDDNFIFGTYDEGITQFRDSSINYFNVRDGLFLDNTVWALMQDPKTGYTWLGTSRGLSILNRENQLISNALDGLYPKIRTIVRLNESTVLLGGDEGLFVMQGDSVYKGVSDLNINKLYILEGTVYCAATKGLFVLNAATNYSTASQIELPETKVYTLTSDFKGQLWIGTENGLFVMLKNKLIWRFQLDQRDYRSKSVFGMITARDSSIWVSGMKGVFRIMYDPTQTNDCSIINYGSAEGLINEEANVNAIYEDHEGNIWVGTAGGLARIDPSFTKDLFDYQLPLLHITGIRLFMEKIDYADFTNELDTIFNVPNYIELPYNKNHVTFDFIGINLKDPGSVQYEYRLLGADDAWSPVSKSNYATYSFLQPGDYIFQVRAMNKNKQWSGVQQIKIHISSPFWKTWWFISLVLIAILLLITYFFQSRIRVLKQVQENEKLDLKNRLLFLEQRSLNASMNRHFIFNSLNSIQYFINSSDKLSANRFLSNFAKLIRKNLDSSAANNFIVTLQEEIDRIELYLSLEKMRFSGKFEYKIDLSSDLDAEAVEIPSMILQPFVENSIIHGVLSLDHSGLIVIRIFKQFGEVVFELTDNGVGVENSLKLKKFSPEGDHESKGLEITNRRIEILRKLTGENLQIIGPFQLNDSEGRSLGTKVILKLGGVEND